MFPAEDGDTTTSDTCTVSEEAAPLDRHKEARVSHHPNVLLLPHLLSPRCSWMKMAPLQLTLTTSNKSILPATVIAGQALAVSISKNTTFLTLTNSCQIDSKDTGEDGTDYVDPAASRRRPHPPHSTNTTMVSGSE